MTIARTQDATSGFAAEIREATWGSHGDAEHSNVMTRLLQGRLPVAGYAELVAQQYFIYEVLEDAGDSMRLDPVAGPFVRQELTRLPALQADLHVLLGQDWLSALRPTEATRAYRERLTEVAFSSPGAFVAHHYVRYMGDLSGGQFIRRTVTRVYGLTPGAGADFYAFDRIPNLAEFKDEYRDLLDRAPWDAAERASIIDEVLRAYELNTRVLNEL